MTTTRRDIVSGAVLAVGAIALYSYVSTFPVRQGQSPAISAGFYPGILAAFLAILAVIQIVSAVVSEVRISRAAAAPDEPDGPQAVRMPAIWKDRKSLGLFSLTVVALVIYPFLMRILGFTVTGLLFVGTLITALSAGTRRGRGLILIVAITIAISILTYLVFRRFLQIPFPSGVFGR